jgi:predicted alpha/beta superfamily hydrolase
MHARHVLSIRLLGAGLLLAPLGATAQATARPTPPPVGIARTMRQTLVVTVTGERYTIDVALPRGFDGTKRHPVVLVLDGDDDFPLAAALSEAVRAECELAVAPIVVGIGDGAGIDMPGSRRGRDYTPTRSDVSWARGEGGAATFLRVLTTDVIPFIEQRYPTNGERALFGYSYGGLFVAYALAEQPSLARTWLMGSPSLFYDDNWAVKRAATIAPTGQPVRVFLSAGARESWAVEGNAAFASALRAHAGAGLELASVTLDGVGHSLGKPEAMRRALAWNACTGATRAWAGGTAGRTP